jgi:hypothetical protein
MWLLLLLLPPPVLLLPPVPLLLPKHHVQQYRTDPEYKRFTSQLLCFVCCLFLVNRLYWRRLTPRT